MRKRTIKKILDVIKFYLFSAVLCMLITFIIFWNIKLSIVMTIGTLILMTIAIPIFYVIVSVLVWLKEEKKIEFILRSPIKYKKFKFKCKD